MGFEFSSRPFRQLCELMPKVEVLELVWASICLFNLVATGEELWPNMVRVQLRDATWHMAAGLVQTVHCQTLALQFCDKPQMSCVELDAIQGFIVPRLEVVTKWEPKWYQCM
jgi:hypothetical protein